MWSVENLKELRCQAKDIGKNLDQIFLNIFVGDLISDIFDFPDFINGIEKVSFVGPVDYIDQGAAGFQFHCVKGTEYLVNKDIARPGKPAGQILKDIESSSLKSSLIPIAEQRR